MTTGSSHIRPRSVEKCTVCQTENPVYCDEAEHYACGKCGALHVYDPARQAFKFLYDNKEAMQARGKIRPYSEGFLRGTWYRVIGITWLIEKEQQTHWQEYLLIDNEQQIITLSNFDGIWLLVRSVPTRPELPTHEADEFELDGEWYYLYSNYYTQVEAVQGEVPYNLLKRETVYTREFLGREQMYIQEDKTTWYTSEYLDAREVKDVFNLPDLDVDSQEFHPLQRNPLAIPRYYNAFLGIVAVVISLLQLFFILSAKENVVYQEEIFLNDQTTGKYISKVVSPPFIIHEGVWATQAVKLETQTDVNNSWMEIYYTLTNEKTGEDISFNEPIEYYHGNDRDGGWSEGDRNASTILSAVPPSTYRLEIEMSASDTSAISKENLSWRIRPSFVVKITENTHFWLNYIVVMCILLLMGIIHYFRFRAKEMKRWELSNMNPYYIERFEGLHHDHDS